ncbi:XRE family transcriptional regulator [Bittarella massiliensis]|uniref:XRE family transcriptional regulator n=1 Tax=Bittarella massiliensis (ex Durand et al. 2017) TaxID=1720313 RepID=UPI00163D3CAC|nr:XRE family transcriptional regulator [Bittarella massiliensis (ex Durand et al. 2017)]MBC2870179.1 XRE family transcriptional regulator [Bittarella massiliensis (ex Durand et al. 2017)]
MSQKSTGELRNELQEAPSLDVYIRENEGEFLHKEFSQYLVECLAQRGLRKSEVIRRSGLSEVYAYQILAGKKRAERDKLICLCLGGGLCADECDRVLRLAGRGKLYPRDRRDAILLYCLDKGLGVAEADDLLYEAGEPTLLS